MDFFVEIVFVAVCVHVEIIKASQGSALLGIPPFGGLSADVSREVEHHRTTSAAAMLAGESSGHLDLRS